MRGAIIQFPRGAHHGRPSKGSRATRAAKSSAVTPFVRATGDSNNGNHQSAGILLRCDHLRTAAGGAPVSRANASIEGQSPMIERNEACGVIDTYLGQFVLERKPKLSRDINDGDSVQSSMASKREFHDAFVARVKQARESKGLSQTEMGRVLGNISQGKYKQYETRSLLPHDLLENFCLICGIGMEWLVTGRGRAPVAIPHREATEKPKAAKPARGRRKRNKAA